jgi:hypothetical protein
MLEYHIKKHYGVSIPHNKIHAYVREKGYAHPNPKKQKKGNGVDTRESTVSP